MSGLFCSPKLYCSTGKLCSFGKLIIISLLLFNIIPPDNAGAVQDNAWYMDFIKTHLDIEPPADWKKEPLERFHNAIGYANRTMGICMMAFPLDDYRQYQLQTDTDWSINFGRTMVHRPYDRNSEELIAPLKNSASGACFVLYNCPPVREAAETTPDPQRLQQALPLLHAFKDFDIPPLIPCAPGDTGSRKELLNRYYSNARSWRIALPPGWSEKAAEDEGIGLDNDYALEHACYRGPDGTKVYITVGASPRAIKELFSDFYNKKKAQFEKVLLRNFDDYMGNALEKNGSWLLTTSFIQHKNLYYLTASKGFYSLVHIQTRKWRDFESGKELLKNLRPDNPELFPQSYE